MAAADILLLVAVVIVLAVAAEMVGDRVGLPNFVFFILAGLALGPAGVGLLDHEVFGEALGVVVGLAVAIILFHSGSGITVRDIRAAPGSVFRMAVGGVIVTFVAMTAVAWVVLDTPFGVAALVGALLVATGTTVIEPLLAAVPVREELGSALDIEATVSEVSAGVLSIAVFQAVTLGEPESEQFVFLFAWVLAVGVVVGAVGGALVWALFRIPEHAPKRAPRHASQLYLGTAIVTYAVAESVVPEAGVAAAATAGVVLGNVDLPYEEHLATIEEDLTTFIIAFLFVVLASFVDPEWLRTVGVAGLVVGVALIVVVRPLAVFLTTAGSTLDVREKLFLSVASPRGIIPAGVATLLAIQIQNQTPGIAATITGTVLLTILVSATFEGLVAGRVAERFDLTVDETLVVGGGRFGLTFADRYADRGERVALIDEAQPAVQRGRATGYTVYHGDGTEEGVLRNAGAARATRIVAATDDDEANHEIARLATETFDVDAVLVRLAHRDNRALFDDLDVELLDGSRLDIWALDHCLDTYLGQASPDWLAALRADGGLRSVTLTDDHDATVDDDRDGTIADLDDSLPDRAFVVSLARDGESRVPAAEETVRAGDRLTLLGRADAVGTAATRLAATDDRIDDGLIEGVLPGDPSTADPPTDEAATDGRPGAEGKTDGAAASDALAGDAPADDGEQS